MDANHTFGNDLVAGANGDLASVTGDAETRQRLLRRLFTPINGYLWNLTYGAGLPQRVGDTLTAAEFGAIKSAILAACAAESGVAQFPAPQIDLTLSGNSLSGNITYYDAATKTPQVIYFPPGN